MKYRVPVKFVIHGAVDVSAPDDATMDELFVLADQKSGDIVEKMASHQAYRALAMETFPARRLSDVRAILANGKVVAIRR